MRGYRSGSSGLYFWLAAAVVIPLWDCIVGREMFVLIDSLHNHFPFQAVLSRILGNYPGALPLWDPFIFSGSPLLADPQRTVYYPPALFYRLLPFAPAFGCFLAFHLFLAAAGTAAFLRARGLGNLPAGLGGIAYALGASPSMLLGAPVVLSGYAWFPWIAFFAARLRAQPGPAAGTGLGLAFAWLALAGYPQYLLYGAVAAALILWLEPGPRPVLWSGRWILLAAGTAVVGAAAQYLPFGEYLLDSNRASRFAAPMADIGSLRPWDLLGFLSPMSLLPRSQEIVFGVPGKWTTLHFCGVLTLALAVTAGVSQRCRKAARLPCVMLGTGVVLAHGASIPGIGPHLLALPPLGWIRHAGLWLCLAEFGLAWLAALGLAEIEKRLFSPAGGRILAGWAAAALLLGSMGATTAILKGWMFKHWPPGSFKFAERMVLLLHPAAVLAFALLFLWLARRKEIGWRLAAGMLLFITWAEVHGVRLKIQPAARTKFALVPGPTEKFIQGRASGWCRVFVTPRHQFRRIEESESLNQAVAAFRDSLRSNLPAAAGLLDAEGDNPLRPKGTEKLLEGARRARNPWEREAQEVFELLGVKFLITKGRIPGASGPPAYEGHVRIYQLPGHCRPAWIEPGDAGRVREAVCPAPGRWAIKAELSRPGTLVLSESFVRGWKSVEGPAGAKPEPAHGALVGIALPAGAHSFELRYDPFPAKAGLTAGGAGLAGLLIAGLAWIRRRRVGAGSR